MKYSVYYLWLVVLVMACGTQQTEEKAKFTEAQKEEHSTIIKEGMAVHDEMMGMWGTLKEFSDSLQTLAPSFEDKKETSDAVFAAKAAVDKGVEAMSVWMREYDGSKAKEENITHEEVMNYYEGQKKAAEEMKVAMKKGHQMALDFFSKYVEQK